MKASVKILAALAAAAVLLALGAGAGWGWAQRGLAAAPAAKPSLPAESGRKVLYWYDPMYPQQHFDRPGKSPFMDMELVPRYADEAGAAGVRIDPATAQNLGVRLVRVERIALAAEVEASGLVGFDERAVAVVQSRSGGFVERVWPLAPGDVVRAGQPLAELLVPEWAAAQHELLAVRALGDAALLAAARERLRLLGMPEAMIRAVEQDGTVQARHIVRAPIGGALQALEVRAGMTLMAGQTLARLNGLATVWLEAAVPEAQAQGVRVGARAEARLAGFPGEAFAGRVTAILPALDAGSRSLRVRVELPNRDGRLRPGMSGQVKLVAASSESALALPTEAVIRTGKRALVLVAEGQGRFAPAEVTLGREIGAFTVIAGGLEEGEQVAASGQFLIDSEASLAGVLARAAPRLHEADAIVEAVSEGALMLEHGPFESLDMPGMTMEFPLARPGLARGLKPGDRVRVGVRATDDGLVIERIERREGEK